VNKGKGKAETPHWNPARGVCVFVISAESLDDPRHLFAVVGAKRSRPDGSPRAGLQQVGRSTLVVGGLEDADEVVGTYGPVEPLEASPVLLGAFSCSIGSLDGVLNCPYPFVGEVQQDDVGRHIPLPPFLSLPLPRRDDLSH
jgi:hypothetical protein